MMTTTRTATSSTTVRHATTAVIVASTPDPRVLDTVSEAAGLEIVVVAPASGAYTQIKRTRPEMVIVCLSTDDVEACQLLSMLKLDRETAGIPLITCVIE